MLARMSASLTRLGPMFVRVMRDTLSCGPGTCARAGRAAPPRARHSTQTIQSSLLRSRIRRNIFTADFGCALKPRVWLQKGQVHVARRPVALFGDEEVHGQGLLRRIRPVVV